MKLWTKIFIGMVAGLIVGLILGPKASYIKPIGSLFINLIKMLIVPLVFSSLVVGVASMKDTKKMGRIGLKTILIYLITTAVAISIGLSLGVVIQPGSGIELTAATTMAAKDAPPVVDTLLNIIPDNPISSLANGRILQIIAFAVLLGIAIALSGEKGKPLAAFFESFAEVMYKLTAVVMEAAPYGVFALIAWVTGNYGLSLLLPLLKIIACVYLACLIHAVIVYGGSIKLLAGLNPIKFFKGIVDAQMVAFTTTSSAGTLPVTMKCAQEKLGVSKSISSFVLPLGATINMDGAAIYQGLAALFVAQVYGIDLTFGNYMTIILTATLASIGTAGVPGGGLIMLSMVLTAVGLPMEGVAIIAGIDRILDMARTPTNITGDAMVATVIAKSENELDMDIYNNGVLTAVTPGILEEQEAEAA